MKVKNYALLNKVNNLFSYFLLTQALFFVTPFFAVAPLEITFDLTSALTAHAASLACFVIGYVLNALLHFSPKRKRRKSRLANAASANGSATLPNPIAAPQWKFHPDFFKTAYILMFAGTLIAILQVAVSRSPFEYLRQLFTGSFDSTIRNAFLATSAEGGLSGVLKIFASVPLSVYLASLSLPHFLELSSHDREQFAKLNRMALVLTAVKVLFSLDRLTIMAVIIANVFITVRTRKRLKLKFALVLVMALLIEFVSRRRMQDVGAWGFVVLYYNLGVVNLNLMMQTLQGHTYGFATLFSPFLFVGRFFGFPEAGPASTFEFQYVAAQYLVGYAYQDFGALFPLFFGFLGFLYKTVDRKVLQQKNIYYVSIYFLVLAVTITFVAVPAFKSVDFWLALLVPLVLVKLFAHKVRARNPLDAAAVSISALPFHTPRPAPANISAGAAPMG